MGLEWWLCGRDDTDVRPWVAPMLAPPEGTPCCLSPLFSCSQEGFLCDSRLAVPRPL